MTLPSGMVCGDCRHREKCSRIFGIRFTNDACDWFPRRFVDRNAPTPGASPRPDDKETNRG
jgi:hypothetical protein